VTKLPNQIGELSFATIAEALEYFGAMLNRYELGDFVDDADTRALLALAERHPNYEQKRGVGILGFMVERAGYNARGFHIIRTDGTSTDFSYRKCLETRTPTALFIGALRTEVQDDILEAKRQYFADHADAEGRSCRLTGARTTIDESHADHAPPYTFQILADTFLAAREIVPDIALLTPPADNQLGRRLLDRELAADWRVYHHWWADIRVVAKSAHSARPEDRPQPKNRQLILRGNDDD
jgi:uncharacterized protein DUF3223